jgi:hypothetical protein
MENILPHVMRAFSHENEGENEKINPFFCAHNAHFLKK